MGFWDTLAGLFGGNSGGNGSTPPYVPQGPNLPPNTPGLPGAQPAQSGLSKALPTLVGGGLSALGGVLNANAANSQNKVLQQRTQANDQLAQQEMARREYYASILLPSLLQALGNKNPQVAKSAMSRQQGAAMGVPGGQPQQQQSASGGGYVGGTPSSYASSGTGLEAFNNGIPPMSPQNPAGLPADFQAGGRTANTNKLLVM